MALEATHIRFALDTQNLFGVEDINKYVSGSIYPDSRYATGIDRILTHDDSQILEDFWENNDFRKGWASHLLYDKIQFSVHAEWFRDILKESDPKMTGEEDWIIRTALKILQDIDDLQHFDIRQYLGALNYIEAPNGEDEAEVKKYNQLFINIYKDAPNVSIEDLEKMWTDWNVSPEVATKMRNKAYEIQADKRLMGLIVNVYKETMVRKDKFYNKYCTGELSK